MDQLIARTKERARALRSELLSQAATAEWVGNQVEVLDLISEGDLTQFLRWPIIRRTMYVDYASYLVAEWLSLRVSPHWGSLWQSNLTEDAVGSPIRFWLQPSSSGNLIHHAYHVHRFLTVVGRYVSFNEVVEFGGGYGGMCRLLKRLFPVSYQILDLPAFSLLQGFFLGATGHDASLVSSPAEILAKGHGARRLFVATWSLSETPIELRPTFEDLVKQSDFALIGYQADFRGINNEEYFRSLADKDGGKWHFERAPHSGVGGHNCYAFKIGD